jgi:hypothetical protein
MIQSRLFILSPFVIFVASFSAWAQGTPPKPEAACASCHRAQSQTQPQTPMGRALELPGANPTLKGHPKLTATKGPYTYKVETTDSTSFYSVTDGTQTITLPILWSFGAGSQSWVFQRNGHWYEGLVSYYPALEGLDTTIGDGGLTPHTLDEAIGRQLLPTETKDCFGCHSTVTGTKADFNPVALQPGVTCQHCHEGSNTHLLDALQGTFDSAPPKLSKLSAEGVSNFCGQCHRTWETVVRNRMHGVVDVRFQPYRLANSKCFDGTDPRISCLACHDPHQDVIRKASSYDSKCLACHAGSVANTSSTAKLTATSIGKSCPVAKTDCVTCHMPKIDLPGGHVAFTDHQIRIVKAGEPFPN